MTDPTTPKSAADTIRESLKADTFIAQFAAAGKELLEQTNRPNVITVEQFEPYYPIFNVDKEHYKTTDKGEPLNPYSANINKLYHRWRHELGINPYEVVYVIASKEDQRVVAFFDRQFSRIRSDMVAGTSARELLPAISRNPAVSRENLIIDASIADLMTANRTPEQIAFFQERWMESENVRRHFAALNASKTGPSGTEGIVTTETKGEAGDDSDGSNTIFL